MSLKDLIMVKKIYIYIYIHILKHLNISICKFITFNV